MWWEGKDGGRDGVIHSHQLIILRWTLECLSLNFSNDIFTIFSFKMVVIENGTHSKIAQKSIELNAEKGDS